MAISRRNSSNDDRAESITSPALNHKEVPCNRVSCPIPFPHYHIRRTNSELQMCDEMAAAEVRDQIMLCRILKGKISNCSSSAATCCENLTQKSLNGSKNGGKSSSYPMVETTSDSHQIPYSNPSTTKEKTLNVDDNQSSHDMEQEECMFHLEM